MKRKRERKRERERERERDEKSILIVKVMFSLLFNCNLKYTYDKIIMYDKYIIRMIKN